MADTKRTVILAGDAKSLKGALKEAEGGVDGFGSKVAGAGKAAALALAGVGLAAGAAAIVSVKAFANFDAKMREVFTLMPGISKDAMQDMTGQVKDFAKEFGVLPNEVVPALYQAISAGVPANNVFTFLETAQKAAKGGVTDLETAVDGISSVVNAYGADVIDATKASDLMFTAVKLGKTDFNQLSSALFNVTPTAAALGVKFEDVTSALARLTAQGTPTSVATTQLRAALLEASKSGTKLSDSIVKLSGKTFAELIASGKSTIDIFDDLRASMPEQAFKDLFGSAEAMNAVLGLTGPQAEAARLALAEMGSSAGATDAAFATMSGGLNDNIAKIKANVAVLALDVGEKLAPAFVQLTEWLLENGPKWREWFQKNVQPVIAQVTAWVEENGPKWKAWYEENVAPVLAAAAAFLREQLPPALEAIGKFVEENFQKFKVYYESDIRPAMQNIRTAIEETVKFVIEHWEKFDKVVGPILDTFKRLVETNMKVVKEVLQIIIDLLGGDFSGAWENTKQLVSAVVTFWVDVVRNGIELLKGQASLLWDAGKLLFAKLKEGAAELWDGTIKPWLLGLPGQMKDLLVAGAALLLEAGKALFFQAMSGMQTLWTDILKPWLQGLPDQIAGALGNLTNALYQKGVDLIQGMVNGILSMAGKVGSAIDAVIPGFLKGGDGKAFAEELDRRFGGAEARAFGGPVVAGRPYLVGERGMPELFIPRQSGEVVPLGRSSGRGMGEGGGTFAPVFNVTVNAGPGSDGPGIRRALEEWWEEQKAREFGSMALQWGVRAG
jgi:TP901 family phage tail tape measure protein